MLNGLVDLNSLQSITINIRMPFSRQFAFESVANAFDRTERHIVAIKTQSLLVQTQRAVRERGGLPENRKRYFF